MTIVRIYNIEPKYIREAMLKVYKECESEIVNVDVLDDSALIEFKHPLGASLAREIVGGMSFPDRQLKADILFDKPQAKPGNELEFSNLPLQFYDFDLKQLIETATGVDFGEQFYNIDVKLELDKYGASKFAILRPYDENLGMKCAKLLNRQYVSYIDITDGETKLQRITVKFRHTSDGVSMSARRKRYRNSYGFGNSKVLSASMFVDKRQNNMMDKLECSKTADEELVEMVMRSSQKFMETVDKLSQSCFQ